jgi:uncharacterized protein (TIGR03086 family)
MAPDLCAQHRRALTDADRLVRQIASADLGNPTPCGDWTLADLLAHMTGQHRGFAAAARAGDAPVDAYAPLLFTLEEWDASVADLLTAFADADPEGEAVLREIAPIPLPMSRVVSAQLLDTAVHAWDIARSLGRPYEPSADLAASVGEIAVSVPDDARRTRPGAAFAPAVRTPGTAWESALAHLGRDPQWGYRPADG